jgi:hypothetical protein
MVMELFLILTIMIGHSWALHASAVAKEAIPDLEG